MDLASLLDALRRDSGPPLFYVVEKPFVHAAEALAFDPLARLYPFLAALGVFAAARALPPGARLRFVALWACSPLAAVYSAEARPYAPLALLALLLFLLTRAEPVSAPRAIPLVAVATALLYTHYLALFLVAALALECAVRRRWRTLAALATAGVLFLPWLPVLARQPPAATGWMRESARASAIGLVSALGGAGRIPDPLGGPLSSPLFLAGAAIGVVLIGMIAIRARRDFAVGEAFIVVAGTLALVAAAGAVRAVAFAGRSEMVVLPIWLWGLARAGTGVRAARIGAWACVAAGALSIISLVAAPRPTPIPQAVVAHVARVAAPGDLVVALPRFILPALLAAQRGTLSARVESLPAEAARHPGWFVPEAPGESQERELERTLAMRRRGAVYILLHPLEATPGMRRVLASRGRAREMLRHPEALLVRWEP